MTEKAIEKIIRDELKSLAPYDRLPWTIVNIKNFSKETAKRIKEVMDNIERAEEMLG